MSGQKAQKKNAVATKAEPNVIPKPAEAVPLLVNQTAAPSAMPDWTRGVPIQLVNDPSYFRNIVLSDLVLIVANPKSKLSQHECSLITRAEFESQIGKQEPKYRLVKITGPPCRIKWASLHRTGDFPAIKGQTLDKASFSVIIHEGNVPEDLKTGFPSLEIEQKAFFDFCEKLNHRAVELMWENPICRKDDKESAVQAALGFMGPDGPMKLETPQVQEKLKRGFMDKSNQAGKSPMVRPPNEYNNYRWMTIKKSVSVELKPGEDPSFEKTGCLINGNAHYIDELMALKPPRDYRPPMILGPKGDKVRLGYNEEDLLGNSDMIVPSFFPKVYDAQDYGVRALYCCVQIVRLGKAEEKDTSAPDYSQWAEDFEGEEVIARITKRKAEHSGTAESGEAKKPKTEEGTPDRGTKRKADSPGPAEPKKTKSAAAEEERERLLREQYEAGMDE